MLNNRFVSNSTVTSIPTGSDALTALGAFQFNIALKVPWVRKCVFLRHLYKEMVILPRQARDKHRENSKKDAFLQVMRSIVGGDTAQLIERGHVDLENRVMTLISTNSTWGTTVQFVQVCKYTALPGPDGGGCHFSKSITAELFNPMIPKVRTEEGEASLVALPCYTI